MDLALNNLQRLICHKPKPTNLQFNRGCSPTLSTLLLPLLSVSLSLSLLPLQYIGLHNSTVKQQMPHNNYFIYTGSGWPKFAYIANPIPPETRHVTYNLHSQRHSCFRFSILLVLYMQDTFVLVSNFEVGHFAHHFLFFSFRSCCERNSIHTALLSHFISLAHSSNHQFAEVCWIHVNVGCSTCIYSTPLVVSLNNKPQLAH